jgi:RNA polymerase sigma-70 factor (ECF subfamily)
VTGNGADADDIVQESFLRLLRAGPQSPEDDQQRRYLYRIASNLMVDRWRLRQRDERAGGGGSVDHLPDPRDQDVARTFAGLNARERALLWLAYVEGESHAEIAASLGVGARSVKVMLFRAKRRLRDLLKARGLSRT